MLLSKMTTTASIVQHQILKGQKASNRFAFQFFSYRHQLFRYKNEVKSHLWLIINSQGKFWSIGKVVYIFHTILD